MEFGDIFYGKFDEIPWIAVEVEEIDSLLAKINPAKTFHVDWRSGFEFLVTNEKNQLFVSPQLGKWRFVFSQIFNEFDQALAFGKKLSMGGRKSYVFRIDSHSDFEQWASFSDGYFSFMISREAEEFKVYGTLDPEYEYEIRQTDYSKWDFFSHLKNLVEIDFFDIKKLALPNSPGVMCEINTDIQSINFLNEIGEPQIIDITFPYENISVQKTDILESDELPF